MTEPGNNPDRQGDLLRPLARESDPRERALLEENLAGRPGVIKQLMRPPGDHLMGPLYLVFSGLIFLKKNCLAILSEQQVILQTKNAFVDFVVTAFSSSENESMALIEQII